MKKKNYGTVPTRFAREVRFDVPTVPYRATENTALEELKAKLLQQVLEQAVELKQNTALRRAANDAAALAWVTPYPTLVFPVLFAEKAQTALLQYRRQARIHRRSLNLLLEAA